MNKWLETPRQMMKLFMVLITANTVLMFLQAFCSYITGDYLSRVDLAHAGAAFLLLIPVTIILFNWKPIALWWGLKGYGKPSLHTAIALLFAVLLVAFRSYDWVCWHSANPNGWDVAINWILLSPIGFKLLLVVWQVINEPPPPVKKRR